MGAVLQRVHCLAVDSAGGDHQADQHGELQDDESLADTAGSPALDKAALQHSRRAEGRQDQGGIGSGKTANHKEQAKQSSGQAGILAPVKTNGAIEEGVHRTDELFN